MGYLKKQYDLLNAIKIVAAFFVVCIHVSFPKTVGSIVIGFARFAVPFFFMISGFFSYYEDKSLLECKYKRKIMHLLKLFSGSVVLYFFYNSFVQIVNNSFLEYVENIFSFNSFAELLIFNNVRVTEALWFIPALIYVYVVFYVIEKKKITNKMYFLIPVLFLIGVILREMLEFIPNLPGIFSKSYLYRNFLFVGIPFFMLGHYIRVNEKKLSDKFSDFALVTLMIIGSAQAVLCNIFHASKSVYVGTLVAVFALFVFAVKNEDKINLPFLSKLGARYSLYVYIFHILIRELIKKLIGIVNPNETVNNCLSWIMPILVFIVTLFVSIIYVKIKNQLINIIKNRRNKQCI